MKTRSSSTLHSEGATAAGSGAPDENRVLVVADINIVRSFDRRYIYKLWKFVEKSTMIEIGRSTAIDKKQAERDLQVILDERNQANAASAAEENSETEAASPSLSVSAAESASASTSASGPAASSPALLLPAAGRRAVQSEEVRGAVRTNDSTACANAASAAATVETAAARSAIQPAQVDALASAAAAVGEDFFGSGPDFETSTRDAARLSCLYGGEFPFVPDGWARGPLPDHAAASEPSSTAMGTGIQFLAALCDETDALDGEAFDDGLLQRGTFINDDPRFYQF